MSEHKNKNEAKGNFGIYQITIFGRIFKFGKADLDRVTQTSGFPTRLHQQLRKLFAVFGEKNVDGSIILRLLGITTKQAKKMESDILDGHIEQTGEIPEGNKKSHKNKKK